MKPRLLIITNRLVIGGISNDLIPLAFHLKSDYDILILHGEKDETEADATLLLAKYSGLYFKKINHFQKKTNFLKDFSALINIIREIKNFNCDIIHTHGPKSGILGRIAAYKTGLPVVVHTYHGHLFHSYYNKIYSASLLKLERFLGRITTTVVAISMRQKKEISEKYRVVAAEKIKVIPLGIEVEKTKDNSLQQASFRKKYCIQDDVIAIGIAGRIVPVKNISMFIQVAQRLIEKTNRKICFVIMGDGFLKREIQDQCSALGLNYTDQEGLSADIIFTSWVEDIIPAIYVMDIVALTSNNEGTPMSLIEAQWCAKPVVATDVGGVKDALIDGETGFLVAANDIDAMVSKIKMLVENDDLRKRFGENAKRFAETNFSKEKEVENYRQLYKSLLTPKKIERSAHQHIAIE